ncbi:MAG: hypothetical protein AB7F23_10400 [Phycisphaerae bacterium]
MVKKGWVRILLITSYIVAIGIVGYSQPGVRHLLYVAIADNLNEPIASIKWDSSKGNVITLTDVKIPLNDTYSIGFRPCKYLPPDYEFEGTCLIRIYRNDKLVMKAVANGQTATEYRIYGDNLSLLTDKVSLIEFVPKELGVVRKNIKIEIELSTPCKFDQPNGYVFYVGIDTLL